MQPELFRIQRASPGELATMARPRGGDDLAGALAGLAAAGVTILVSLLSDAEVTELGLADEEHAAAAAGLEFLRLPTPDLTVPDTMFTRTLAGMLRSRLAAGASVAVHCRCGVGRSSTLAAAVLVFEGVPASAAWDLVAAARGRPVPDTPAQRDFIERLAASNGSASHGPAEPAACPPS